MLDLLKGTNRRAQSSGSHLRVHPKAHYKGERQEKGKKKTSHIVFSKYRDKTELSSVRSMTGWLKQRRRGALGLVSIQGL